MIVAFTMVSLIPNPNKDILDPLEVEREREKMYGLYGLKHHIVEISGDVREAPL